MGAGDVADPRLDGISAGETVLHVSRGAGDGTVCRRLERTDGDRPDRLRIAYDRATAVSSATGREVNRTRVIAVGSDCDRSTGPRVRTVQSPDDLAGVGIRVGETLDELGDTDRPLVACVDGIDVAIATVSFESAFQFVHLLTRQLSSAGARAHFHLDPTDLEEGVVSRLSSLFDVVVREESDGELAVQSR